MRGLEIRKMVLGLIESGHKSLAEVAKFLKISQRSIQRWQALAKQDDLAPKTNGPRKKKLDPEALRLYIAEHPDHILSTIAQHFNVRASSIWYRLKCMNITLKKRRFFIGSAMKPSAKNL